MRSHIFGAIVLGLALSTSASASAQGPAAAGATASDAEQHFKRGIKLFDDGDFKLALVEFERSYELVPNFRVLYNIGEVQFQLNHYAAALRTLSHYLEVGGERILPNRRAEVQRDLEALKIRTAHLGVNVNVPGAEILVDGERIGRSPLVESELIDAGAHRLVVQKQGYVAYSEAVTLAGADERAVDVRLAPVPEVEAPRIVEVRESPGLGPVWIGWGPTVALGIATVGTTVAWQNADSKLTDLKNSPSSATEREGQARSVDTLRTASFVLGGTAIAAAGVSLFFTLKRSSDSTKTTTRRAMALGVGPASLRVSGSF